MSSKETGGSLSTRPSTEERAPSTLADDYEALQRRMIRAMEVPRHLVVTREQYTKWFLEQSPEGQRRAMRELEEWKQDRHTLGLPTGSDVK